MSRWYCEEHRHLDPSPNRVHTFNGRKKCCLQGCKNELIVVPIDSKDIQNEKEFSEDLWHTKEKIFKKVKRR